MSFEDAFLTLQQPVIAVPIVLATMAAFAIAKKPWAAIYVGLMPLINWSFAAVPTTPIPEWMGGGQFQPLAIVTGLVLVTRDFAQRELKHWIFGAMFVGLGLSSLTSYLPIIFASGASFLISETIDWAVYTFSNRPLSQRVLISSAVSAPVDQIAFLALASLVTPGILALGTVITGIISKMIGAWIISVFLAHREAQRRMNPA